MDKANLFFFLVNVAVLILCYRWGRKWAAPKHSVYLNEVHVPERIGEFLNEYVTNTSIVYIATGDTHFFNSEKVKAVWLGVIENWLKTGAEVCYVCVDRKLPSEISSRLRSIGNLRVLEISKPKSENFRSRYATYHPVIVAENKSDGKEVAKALWIENLHPYGSDFAFGVEFVVGSQLKEPRYQQVYNETVNDFKQMSSIVAS